MTQTETPAPVPACAACGGPIHNPTWGCVRPTPAEPSTYVEQYPGELIAKGFGGDVDPDGGEC